MILLSSNKGTFWNLESFKIIGQTWEIYGLLKNVIIVIFAMKCTLIQTSASLYKIHRILYHVTF